VLSSYDLKRKCSLSTRIDFAVEEWLKIRATGGTSESKDTVTVCSHLLLPNTLSGSRENALAFFCSVSRSLVCIAFFLFDFVIRFVLDIVPVFKPIKVKIVRQDVTVFNSLWVERFSCS